MKAGQLLILGSAIAGCTAALAIYLAAKGSPQPPGLAPQAAAPTPKPLPVGFKRHATPDPAKPAGNPGQRASAAIPAVESETPPAFRILGKPPSGRVADEREWFANAERIERQANRELANLRETLELSPKQQQHIFDTLARNSPSWMPGMMTGGSHGVGIVGDASQPANRSNQPRPEPSRNKPETSGPADLPDTGAPPAASLTDEVLVLLDYDQQQALIQEELNRRAWWEEVLPQLLPPEFPAAGLPGDGDTKAYEGPTGLLEE